MGRYMIGRQCVKGIQNSESRQGRKKDRMKESVQNELHTITRPTGENRTSSATAPAHRPIVRANHGS